MTARYRKLLELIHDEAEEHFRSAFRYDEGDWEALYIRSDLATAELEGLVPRLAARARAHEPIVRTADYPELGAQRASISLHTDAVLLHVPEGPNAGVVLTLDTAVAPDLSRFVSQCERVLEDGQDDRQ